MSRWCSIRSITGCGVVGSNSVELASVRPSTLRANSIVITCSPRHMPEARHVVLAGVAGGGDLALDAALAEPAGDDHPVEVAQPAGGQQTLDLLGLDPVDLDLGTVVEAGVLEALDDREVGVLQLTYLPIRPMRTGRSACSTIATTVFPRAEIDRRVDAQHLADDVVEALVVQDQRQLVDVAGVGGVDHRALVDVAEVGDLALQVVAQRLLAAAHDHVGLDAAAAQLGDRVLRRLGLLLARRADERHQRDVDVADVVAPGLLAELADGLEEREDLDVADGAADLGDDHVDVVGGQAADPSLDLVGDVRDDLHGLAEVVAAALGGEHGLVDAARSWRWSCGSAARR